MSDNFASRHDGGEIDFSPAKATNFRIFIREFPTVAFFTTDALVPAVNLSQAPMNTPFGRFNLSDNTIEFDPLTIGFTVDENLRSYTEIYEHVTKYANPNGPAEPGGEQFAFDIFIQALDNNKNPVVTFKLIGCRPISIGQIVYNTQDEQNNNLVSDVTIVMDWIQVVKNSDEIPSGIEDAQSYTIPR